MIRLLIPMAAGITGYLLTRKFVARRLRFVDAAQSALAPLVAGVLAALVASPLSLLPAVTGSTAILFGIGAALGTASARRVIRRADAELRRLTP